MTGLAIGQRVENRNSIHVWTGTVVALVHGCGPFFPSVDVQLDALGDYADPMRYMVADLEPILGPVHQTKPHQLREPTPEEEALAREILQEFSK